MSESESSPEHHASKAGGSPRFTPCLAVALLAVLTLTVFWPATRCGFTNYDDPLYVTSNAHVQSGLNLQSVKWAACSVVSANWHPATMLSHMLDCQLFGLNPWGHHLTSILLHTVNTILVFVLLRIMTGTMWQSLFVAAIWGVHPLRVESVVWIAERKDVLSGCLGLLSLIFYCRYAKTLSVAQPASGPLARPQKLDYGLALLFLALGLLSKPMLVTWPFVMLLLDYWPLARFQSLSIRRLLMEKVPFLILVVVSSVVTFVVQRQQGAMSTWKAVPIDLRSENALVSYARYLGKLFCPTNLAAIYLHPGYWPTGIVLGAGVLLLGLSALFWVQRRQYPFLLMGWLWFCGTLVPVIGLVQVGPQALADRYTYLPSLGVLIIVVWGACELFRRWPRLRIAGLAGGVLAILLCCQLTRHQVPNWRDGVSLFRQVLKVTEDTYSTRDDQSTAHYDLGAAFDGSGRIPEAILEYQQALKLNTNDPETHHSLGVDLGKQGDPDGAIQQLQESIRLKPDDATTHNDLGNALDSKGQTDDAIREYQAAIGLKPDNAEAHSNLGAAFGKQGKVDQAISELQQALRLKTDDPLTYYNLAMAYYSNNQTNQAIVQLQAALRLNPNFTAASEQLNALQSKP